MIERSIPELWVQNVDDAVRYYTDVLGFELIGRLAEDAGDAKPATWAMVRQGEAYFQFAPTKDPRATDGVIFYLEVKDVDATAEKLRSRGARIVAAPADQWYGWREMQVEDAAGYRLAFFSLMFGGDGSGAHDA